MIFYLNPEDIHIWQIKSYSVYNRQWKLEFKSKSATFKINTKEKISDLSLQWKKQQVINKYKQLII